MVKWTSVWALEAEKTSKTKWELNCGTPCIRTLLRHHLSSFYMICELELNKSCNMILYPPQIPQCTGSLMVWVFTSVYSCYYELLLPRFPSCWALAAPLRLFNVSKFRSWWLCSGHGEVLSPAGHLISTDTAWFLPWFWCQDPGQAATRC